jgi:hypothetical protein
MKRYILSLKYKFRYYSHPRLWEYLSSKIKKFRQIQYEEKLKSFGSLNPTLTFYVIRRRPPAWGLFSNIFYVVQGIIYAEKNNYIPVVDMENYWVGELSSIRKINGTYNAWCYLFEQISNYSLGEVYKSRNVILSNGSSILGRDHWLVLKNHELITNPESLKLTGELVSKYIRLNNVTRNFLKSTKTDLEWDGNHTLGIFVRGGNYYFNAGTRKQDVPSFDFLVTEINSIMQENQLKKIYICTENFRFFKKLSDALQNYSILSNLRYPKHLTLEAWDSQQKLTFDNSILMGYEKSLLYLTEVLLLSECAFTLSTNSNASTFALCLNNLSVGDHRLVFDTTTTRIKM